MYNTGKRFEFAEQSGSITNTLSRYFLKQFRNISNPLSESSTLIINFGPHGLEAKTLFTLTKRLPTPLIHLILLHTNCVSLYKL